MVNRREFMRSTGTLLLMAPIALPIQAAALPDNEAMPFQIDPQRRIGVIPTDMMGLSYESTQLGDPSVFSPANRDLIGLFRTLSARGNLRLGGNTSEFTYFAADDAVAPPAWSPLPTQPRELTPITPRALRNLRGFLDATGWTCIYGLNLGTGTPERAAQEAAAVTEILGDTLAYVQIGNEPNNYIRYKLRPASWDRQAYLAQWVSFARAIIARVPDVKLGGPDMYADGTWVQYFAHGARSELGRPPAALTNHYYAEGPPTSPQATLENLLSDRNVDDSLAVMTAAGAATKLPYRMTEVNSCYQGGKPGVSDTLGSALWAANLTLRLAQSGFCGVNFHGGSARQIRASLGGSMPGDTVAKSAAADSYYTPIAGTAAEGYRVRPIFAGMMMAARLAGSDLVAGTFLSPQSDVLAYATAEPDRARLRVAVFNMGRSARAIVIGIGRPVRSATALRLTGPGPEATRGVRFGDGDVASTGDWMPSPGEALNIGRDGRPLLTLPPTSAALVALETA